MSASTSGTAWVRATPTGRFLVVLPARHRQPSRLLRASVVLFLMFWLLIGG